MHNNHVGLERNGTNVGRSWNGADAHVRYIRHEAELGIQIFLLHAGPKFFVTGPPGNLSA